jgi:hypothetical protein
MTIFLVIRDGQLDGAYSRRRDAELRAQALHWSRDTVIPITVDGRL